MYEVVVECMTQQQPVRGRGSMYEVEVVTMRWWQNAGWHETKKFETETEKEWTLIFVTLQDRDLRLFNLYVKTRQK